MTLISTNNLAKLPSRDELRRLTQSLATLEAIIERDWASRYYSFNKNWDEGGEQLASMRNGEGDSWFCVFSPHGAFLKGFDHECELASRIHGNAFKWPGLLDQVPRVFESYIKEPAFSMRETTFCIWQTAADSSWHTGPHILSNSTIADGSGRLLIMLDRNPRTYQMWAEAYYRRKIDIKMVEQIYSHQSLTEKIVRGLNPVIGLAELIDDLAEIGYPVATN